MTYSIKKHTNILIFVTWIIALFILTMAHTPWRDEFQSFLVSTRTAKWDEFFEAVRYERHPPLHYLLQRFIHSLNLDIAPRNEILFATFPFTIGIALLLLLLNLPPFILIGILFSPYLLREHGIISRCYPIGGFLFILASLFYTKNKKWLFIISLVAAAYVHLIFTVASLGWIILLGYRKKISRPQVILALVTAIPSLALQLPPPDSSFPSHLSVNIQSIYSTVTYLAQMFLSPELHIPFKWNSFSLANILGFPIGIFLLVKAKKNGTIFHLLLMIIPTLYLVTNTYAVSTRYLASFFWILIAIYYSEDKIQLLSSKTLKLFSALSIISTTIWIVTWQPWNPRYNFSDSVNLVNTFHFSESDILITDADAYVFPVMALSNKTIFDIRRNTFVAYPKFKTSQYKLSFEQWCTSEIDNFIKMYGKNNIYWIANKNSNIPESCKKHLGNPIYKTTTPVFTDEEYAVFKFIN